MIHSKRNEAIFILHPPRSSYYTRQNFSKLGLHRAYFHKIFQNNYSTKHLKKNLPLKNFKSRLLYEGKSKERIRNWEPSFASIIKTSYFEKICKLPRGKLTFYFNLSIWNPYIILINLGTSAYTSNNFQPSTCLNVRLNTFIGFILIKKV